jgi:hypothetical protein
VEWRNKLLKIKEKSSGSSFFFESFLVSCKSNRDGEVSGTQ